MFFQKALTLWLVLVLAALLVREMENHKKESSKTLQGEVKK